MSRNDVRSWLYRRLNRFARGPLRNSMSDILANAYEEYYEIRTNKGRVDFVEKSQVSITFSELCNLLEEWGKK